MKLPERPRGGCLGLDLARRSGWAYASFDGEHAAGEIDLPSIDQWGPQTSACYEAICALCDAYSPRYCAVEAPISIKTDTEANYRTSFGLASIAALALYQANVTTWFVVPKTVRATVLRDGNLSGNKVKSIVVQWVRDRGWFVPGHDAADATVVREYCARMARVRGARTDTPFDGHRFWRDELL